MNSSTKGEIKGKSHELKGKAGQGTNNPDSEAGGEVAHTADKAEKKVGQIEKMLEK